MRRSRPPQCAVDAASGTVNRARFALAAILRTDSASEHADRKPRLTPWGPRVEWRGADAAYVLSVDARPLDPCRDLQAMMDAAPWLDPGTIVALVETRLQAIMRRGRSGVTVDWDGGLHVAGADGPG